MDFKDRYIRIARYISGECTKAEKVAFEREMKNDPELMDEVEELKNVWGAKKINDQEWDVDTAWKRFNTEVRRKESHSGKAAILRKDQIHQKNTRLKWMMRMVAVIVLAGFTTLFVMMSIGDPSAGESITMNEVATESGQRIQIHLQDGTKIHLNAESKISYPKIFDEDSRYVHLSGEAYFEVESDERPFHVFTDDITVEILGTQFNVKSYEEEIPEVVVTSGKVGVRLTDAADDYLKVLAKGDMASMNVDGEKSLILSHDVDIEKHVGWLDYRLSFENKSMASVGRQLERWYGVSITFDDPLIERMTVNASFEDASIHEVLRVLTLALDLNHEISGSNITLFRNNS